MTLSQEPVKVAPPLRAGQIWRDRYRPRDVEVYRVLDGKVAVARPEKLDRPHKTRYPIRWINVERFQKDYLFKREVSEPPP